MSGLDLLAALRAEPRMRDDAGDRRDRDRRSAARRRLRGARRPARSRSSRSALLAALERAGVRPDTPGGILVVDDDPGALRLMDATLAQLGFAAITRSSGASALEAAAKLHPEAVVLDLMMPGMDGFEFLDRFRRLPGARCARPC